MANREEYIRRKRRIQRRRQLRRRRIAFLISIITIIVVIVLLIAGYISKNNKENVDDSDLYQTEEITSEEITSEEVSLEEVEAEEELTDEEKKQYVLDHPEEYTDELIEFMNKYDQTIDFAYNYKDRDSISISEAIYEEETETAFPLYIQWDARWGYEEYADSIIGIAGCGPTTLAMVYEGLTGNGNQTPITIANMSESNGYSLSGGGSTWELMTEGANDLGLNSQELPLYESKMIEELENGRAIICNVGPGDFTEGGHFIVITGYEDGKFIVNDPNSIENSSILWEYSVLESQIKNLWSFWV